MMSYLRYLQLKKVFYSDGQKISLGLAPKNKRLQHNSQEKARLQNACHSNGF